MDWKLFFTIGLFFSSGLLKAQSSHLLLVSLGEGALTTGSTGETVPLSRASYLPMDQTISVRTKGGLETMVPGSNFRFGSQTNFIIEEDGVALNAGSVMIQSRKIEHAVTLKCPEVSLSISGAGTCLVEVGTNGGCKIVGVLGRFRLQVLGAENLSTEVMPGELCFLMPGDRGFGKKININLEKLISSSFLLSAFPNAPSLENSLKNIAKQQEQAIGKSFNAEVGDSKDSDSFEIVENNSNSNDSDPKSQKNLSIETNDQGYSVPEIDPLTELLGRAPRRFGEDVNRPVSPEVTKELEKITQKSVKTPPVGPAEPIEAVVETVPEEASPRPFPSRLLRKNNLEN